MRVVRATGVALVAVASFGCGEDELRAVLAPPEVVVEVRPVPPIVTELKIECRGQAWFEVINQGEEAVDVVDAVVLGDENFTSITFAPDRLEPRGSMLIGVELSPVAEGFHEARLLVYVAAPIDEIIPIDFSYTATETSRPPLDLVVALDVSTSMAIMPDVRDALAELFDSVEAQELDAKLGLVTFVNDVIVHGGGLPLERATFFAELQSQLRYDYRPDEALPRNQLNYDWVENALDAIYEGAAQFAFRDDARHLMLVATDNTFRTPPYLYSGNTPAVYTYYETQQLLADKDVILSSINHSYYSEGFSTNFGLDESLVLGSGGRWFNFIDLTAGNIEMEEVLDAVIEAPCDG